MSDLVPSRSSLPHTAASGAAGGALAPRDYPYSYIEADRELSLKDLLLVLRKRKLILLSILAGCVGLAIALNYILTPQYSATATIQIGKEADDLGLGSMSGLASAVSGQDDLKTELGTHIGVLQNASIALRVYHDLGLGEKAPFKHKPSFIGRLTGADKALQAEAGRPIERAPLTRDKFLQVWSKKLVVKAEPDTRLIDVTFTNPNPELAASVANDVVKQYVDFYLETRYQATAQVSKWLSSQLDQLKQQVTDSEQKVADYQKKTGISGLLLLSGASGGSGASGAQGAAAAMTHMPVLDKLDMLNQQLTSAETARIAKEAIYKLTQTQAPDVVMGLASSPLASVAGSAVLSQGSGLTQLESLRTQQAGLKVALADVTTKYGVNNPRVLEARNQLSAIDQEISAELQRINQRAANDLELAKQSEAGIRKAYQQQQAAADKLNDGAVQLALLTQEAGSSRALYEDLYAKLQAANLEAGEKATNILIADPARHPSTPKLPNLPLFLGVGIGAGLFLGIASAFVRESLDSAVVTPDQVETAARLPVLSSIPLMNKTTLQSASQALVPAAANERSPLISQPGSTMAEAYRSLRTSVLLSRPGGKLGTLMVTSPLGTDGKTTVTYNLAVSFAQKGMKVVVVDADMRKPRQHTMFNAMRVPGLSDLLTSPSMAAGEVLQAHPLLPNLALLSAGPQTPLPVELLSSERFDTVMAELRSQFDLVLIDTPPVLLVTDAAVLASRADSVLAVVRSGVTNRAVVQRLSEVLTRSGAPSLGLVLNAVDTQSAAYYYAYGYYGGNYYAEERAANN